ncbi:MAG: methyltransferase domain-containing protein [Verrucomicrobiaceae bacterium]|nr:methyltransferase domain-containing protein [Verrucomicrobiaceae bacterium]
MRECHLSLLVCPECQASLALSQTKPGDGDRICSGTLTCVSCHAAFPIIDHIPRFVSSDNYARNFGLEWTRHARTQYDSHSGATVSEDRFFKETGWPRDLVGEHILEVGSGSGRFTEQAAKTGAMVVSFDFSFAVEANYASNGHKANVLIVQADLLKMPLRRGFFDKLYCFGVLQHTPDVRRSFLSLPPMLKPGGDLCVDVYSKKVWWVELLVKGRWIRPLTRHLPPHLLYALVNRYVRLMWPLATQINKLPLGMHINLALLVADYRGHFDLSEEMLKEWAILDTFDLLSAYYDQPQTVKTLQQWFEEAGLDDIRVHLGFNGIEGHGKAPQADRRSYR